MSHYILVNKQVVKCSLLDWAQSIEKRDNHVGYTNVGHYKVSTFFLGLYHRFHGGGPPIVFETMVIDSRAKETINWGGKRRSFSKFEGYQERYSTYTEAITGHKRACRLYSKFRPSLKIRVPRKLKKQDSKKATNLLKTIS